MWSADGLNSRFRSALGTVFSFHNPITSYTYTAGAGHPDSQYFELAYL